MLKNKSKVQNVEIFMNVFLRNKIVFLASVVVKKVDTLKYVHSFDILPWFNRRLVVKNWI